MNRICSQAGCKQVAQPNSHRCIKHPIKSPVSRSKAHNRDKQGKDVHKSKKWQELRSRYLKNNPLCEHCKNRGFIVAAMDIDHVIEVQDDPSLAYEYSNLQALCRSCHGVKTALERKKRNNAKK